MTVTGDIPAWARTVILLFSLALAGQPVAAATGPSGSPTLTPPGAHSLIMPKPLHKADAAQFKKALAEAKRKRWSRALKHADKIHDPIAKRVIRWLWLTGEGGTPRLTEILAFRDQNPDWPRRTLLSRRAEDAFLDQPSSDTEIITWFQGEPPVTGEGKIRFGTALIGAGRQTEGESWIQRGWIEHRFSRAREKEILAVYQPYLPAHAHEDRLQQLLWDKKHADARRMANLLGSDAKALTTARIKLMSRSSGIDAALKRVPSHLQADPGLIYDRARFKRRRGKQEEVLPLLLTAPTQPHLMVRPKNWWTERRIAARHALEEGLYNEAYSLARAHGMTEGVGFAEGEFLAGWVALQFLNKPDLAAEHFKTLSQGVTTPISKARAAYWRARAASANGRKDDTGRFYREAASYPITFYGQLATSALRSMGGDGHLRLPRMLTPSPAARTNVAQNDQVRALAMLHKADKKFLARTFALNLAKQLNTSEEIATLSDIAMALGLPNLSVRVAKIASQRNVLLPERAYPVAVIPDFTPKGPPVEPALVYGLSRQESEFDPRAVSHAGARGLMQLMPSTAKLVARQIREPYSRKRLLSDPAYNALLGTAHLGDLLSDFTGSYIMTIAAYNAGGHRVKEWVSRFGDPRSAAVDPIDWVENIPFTETRNYVQRVLENTQIYRNRLSNDSLIVQLDADLHRNTGLLITDPAPTRGPQLPLAPPEARRNPAQSTNQQHTPDTAPAPRKSAKATPQPKAPVRAAPNPVSRPKPAADTPQETPTLAPAAGILGTIPASALKAIPGATLPNALAALPATPAPATPPMPRGEDGVPIMAPIIHPADTTASITPSSAPQQ